MIRPFTFPPFAGLRVRYLMVVDLLFIWLAILLAFMIRYEALVDVWPYLRLSWTYFILVPLVQLPTYSFFHLYRRLWRYASTKELLMVVAASAVSSVLIYLINFGLLPLLGIPYMRSGSIWLLASVLSLLFLGGSRFFLRMLQERYRPQELLRLRAFVQNPTRLLIVGAGDSGAMIVREILANPTLGYRLVGIVDDNPAKYRYSLHGVPVLGNRLSIPEIVKTNNVDQIIIAIPTASGKDIRDIVRICEGAGIHPRTIPGLYSLLDGRVSLSQVRNVEIEDLLRRDPILTNTTAVRELLHGKRVLVTGGGGSIGSELCRQILRWPTSRADPLGPRRELRFRNP